MKRMNLHVRGIAALALAAICLAPVTARAESPLPTHSVSGPAGAAMQKASQEGKYLFVYFWKQNDEQTQLMQGVFQQATTKMSDVADAISVQITDPNNAGVVKQFGVSRAPMPLALAIAPNGAVTGGLPVTFQEQQLRDAIVSPATATCLKAMQDRKLVLLCVKRDTNAVAFQGAHALTQDERFAASTQIVNVDPTDASEQSFLQSLKVDVSAGKGVMVVLTPPGQPVATFAENATKDEIVERLTAASSACCPDGQCAPGQQCCPGGNCAPAAK
ncbi:hypothetical protein RISK_002224 [Rhodopirellula islandica]|uniref:Signal peptide and transmembrane protein n=2 Tax=Rhodopirellula islandica TaxID=595434 RepID=A0A0J1BGB9_RHOIS|nr:hypothetical protein RISK_002224 [Rhodopirellula islandica]